MLERLISVGLIWAPTLAFVSSEIPVMHSGLVNIYFTTFSYVSYAHGTKSYTINHILCTYQLFGPLIRCRGTKNYEIRNRSVHFHNIEPRDAETSSKYDFLGFVFWR